MYHCWIMKLRQKTPRIFKNFCILTGSIHYALQTLLNNGKKLDKPAIKYKIKERRTSTQNGPRGFGKVVSFPTQLKGWICVSSSDAELGMYECVYIYYILNKITLMAI